MGNGMIRDLVGADSGLAALCVALLVFGFAPGLLLALIVRLIPDLERRRELQAELYEVPRWERPFWVAEQFEVAIRVGLWPQVEWFWGRHLWHRAKLESGLARNLACPSTFWVPNSEEKGQLCPGDHVKLMWSVKRFPGERMWVTITHRDGQQLTGTLNNYAVFAYLEPGEVIKFHIDDIIDYSFGDDVDAE